MAKLVIVALLGVIVGVVNAGHTILEDANFACAQQGRFIDHADSNCRRYHLCLPGSGGKWKQAGYECPDGTIFDAVIQRCSSGSCQSSESSDSSDNNSDYDDDEFECRKPGLHDNIKDPDCASYYECRKNHRGVLFAVQYPCPPPNKFNPVTKQCSPHYVCPRHFECAHEGRFEDGTDDNNKRYFLCIESHNVFKQTVFTCPLYSRFLPEYQLCAIPDEIASDELDIHDNNLPTENWDNLDSFKCKSRGFFAGKGDKASQSYYLCDTLADGRLTKYILSCARNYFFDGNTLLCTGS